MKKQKLNLLKKGLITIIITLLLLTVTITPVKAFSFFPGATNGGYGAGNTSSYTQWMNLVTNWYTENKNSKQALGKTSTYLGGVDTTMPIGDFKIDFLGFLQDIGKEFDASAVVSKIVSMLGITTVNSNAQATPDIVNELLGVVTNLLGSGNLSIQSLTPNEVVDIEATTAGSLCGEKYNVKLVGKIYYANIENGQPTSNKWVLLLHGVLMNGQAMADAVGEIYLDQGYNILAIDSRGHGDSEGGVAMGYLESLDAWDWLTFLKKKDPNSQIVIHGTSLGGATTVFTSGLKIGNETLKNKNVIGVIEDCGYTSLTGIIKGMLGGTTPNELIAKILGIFNVTDLSGLSEVDQTIDSTIKTLLINTVDVGLTEENFDTYQDGLKSVKACEVPILIIHGTMDTTVPYSNSEEIFETAKNNTNIPYIQRYSAQNQPHAFVMVGTKFNAYKAHVDTFIEEAQNISAGKKPKTRVVEEIELPEENSTLLTSLIRALKLIKNMLG